MCVRIAQNLACRSMLGEEHNVNSITSYDTDLRAYREKESISCLRRNEKRQQADYVHSNSTEFTGTKPVGRES